jgi:tripartite-type tricarboxylate transporter receptor subunit TctC
MNARHHRKNRERSLLRRTKGAGVAAVCGWLAISAGKPVTAQPAFPAKPIRLIVASVPSGAMDTIARVVSGRLGDALGQQVLVDNRGGASGAIAAELSARAPADGHTLMFGGNGNLAIAPFLKSPDQFDLSQRGKTVPQPCMDWSHPARRSG